MYLRRSALVAAALATTLLTGCASVATMSDAEKLQAITENGPEGTARVYVYRDHMFWADLY